MAKVSARSRQIGDQMHRELAELLQFHLKDPRLGMVTITAVEVNSELEYATVYVTALAAADKRSEMLSVLNGAAGFLRKELARRIRLRVVPQLKFVYDQSLEHGNYISALIADAVARENPDAGEEE